MGSYSPAAPPPPDNEATRPCARVPPHEMVPHPPGNFFCAPTRRLEEHEEPRGVPRRTRVCTPPAFTPYRHPVAALGIACLIIGLSTYVTLQNSLYQQAQSDLKETSHRVGSRPRETVSKKKWTAVTCRREASFAPGQASGTIITCVESEGAVEIASKLGNDGTIQTLSANDQVASEPWP